MEIGQNVIIKVGDKKTLPSLGDPTLTFVLFVGEQLEYEHSRHLSLSFSPQIWSPYRVFEVIKNNIFSQKCKLKKNLVSYWCTKNVL